MILYLETPVYWHFLPIHLTSHSILPISHFLDIITLWIRYERLLMIYESLMVMFIFVSIWHKLLWYFFFLFQEQTIQFLGFLLYYFNHSTSTRDIIGEENETLLLDVISDFTYMANEVEAQVFFLFSSSLFPFFFAIPLCSLKHNNTYQTSSF